MNEQLDNSPGQGPDNRLDEELRRAFAPPPEAVFAAQARSIATAPAGRPVWPWLLAVAVLFVVTSFAIDRARR
ncbi:MAG: hypothetical protein ABIP94_20825, partial [Planctomycetota bacterium]